MGIMVYSLLWVMQDLYHQPYHLFFDPRPICGPGVLHRRRKQPTLKVSEYLCRFIGLGFRGLGFRVRVPIQV